MRLTVERARVMPGLHDFDWFCLSPINLFEKIRCAHAVSDTTALDLQLAQTPKLCSATWSVLDAVALQHALLATTLDDQLPVGWYSTTGLSDATSLQAHTRSAG